MRKWSVSNVSCASASLFSMRTWRSRASPPPSPLMLLAHQRVGELIERAGVAPAVQLVVLRQADEELESFVGAAAAGERRRAQPAPRPPGAGRSAEHTSE